MIRLQRRDGRWEQVRSPQPELKNVNVTVWYGLFAPAKTAPVIVTRLYNEIAAVMKEAEMQTKLADVNLRVVGSSPAEFSAFLAKEIEKYAAIVKAAKNYNNPEKLLEASRTLGAAMPGLDTSKLPEAELMQTRGW